MSPTTVSAKPIVICVYCGASTPKNPVYMAAAKALGEAMHRVGAHLVYGGGTVGMMGEVARTLVSLSGPSVVHGIIPDALVKYEQAGTTRANAANGSSSDNATTSILPDEALYGRTTIVKDMHTRKKMMAQEVIAGAPGSGFVALPGGYGTMEELFEVTTWNQLGIHRMPVCVLNTNGFFDGLVSWINLAADDGFIQEANRGIITEAKDPDSVISALAEYKVAEGRFNLDWKNMTPTDEKTSFV